MTKFWMTGLTAATFTPFHANGSLNLAIVPNIVDQLINDGVKGLYVCGSTGEGVSLTREERMATAEAHIKASHGRIPVIVQVGHTSLAEAKLLAQHAQHAGADAISATPPTYFKPHNTANLIDCLAEVISGAPNTPFYYYHIPPMTGVNIDMTAFLQGCKARLPSMVGVKFSSSNVPEMQTGVMFDAGRYNFLFGSDEMLFSGLAGGAQGAVGSTYNLAAPLYNRIIAAFNQGDFAQARQLQGKAVAMVNIAIRYTAMPALKAMMGMIGLDVGSTRLPLPQLTAQETEALRTELTQIGYFDWGRK